MSELARQGGLLAGKVAFVTAAAGAGIGQGVVRRFVDAGASVIITDHSESRASRLAADLNNGARTTCTAIQMDVRNREQIAAAVRQTLEIHGRIDVLVNNAGINSPAPLWEMDDATWESVIDVNLNGVFRMMKAVLPTMIEQRSGAIISLASINGWIGSSNEAHYCASKAGVMALTRAAAVEVGKYGIRVNAIAPGLVFNEYMAKIYPPGHFENYEERVPLGRTGKPADIGDVAVFLACDMSCYITGETICVSGGSFMHH